MSDDKSARTVREGGATIRDDGSGQWSSGDQTVIEHRRGAGCGLGGLEFRIVETLPARGAEADLFIVREGAQLRVLKLYRTGIEPSREMLERCESVSRACPAHVVKVFKTGFSKNSGRWYELLEYIPNGSVADAFREGKKFVFREFARELASAVNALHARGLVHRDLKPANILIRSEYPLNLVLSDFGVASALDDASVRETDRKGFTPMYVAPEDMLGQLVSRRADWWACGMIFYELALGIHPFQGLSPSRIAFILSTRGVEIDAALPADQRTLLAGLLTKNDQKRWGWEQIKAWLGGDEDIPVYNEQPADPEIRPFVYRGRPYRDLRSLALAFAADYPSYKLGKGMLARGNVAKWLQNNNQFDEEAIISEEIADNDPDLYIFKFIRKYAPELPFVIAGLPLSAQTIIRCLTDGGEAGTYVVSLFADGKIKKFFPLLPAQILDPMLEAFAEADWKKDVRVAFAATVASENFYWGPGGAPRTALERIKFAQRHPSLLAMTVWRERGGPAFVIPPDIAALFNDDKYDEAIASLFERAKCHRLLKTDDLREKYAANVFTRSETDYAREVYRKIEGDPRFLSLRSEIRSFAESDGSGREHIEISGANPYAGIDLESILRALREAAPESVRGPLETFLEIDDPEEIFKRVRENDDIFHGSSPIFAPGNGAPLFDIIFGGSGYQEFESALKNMATKISERYDVQFEFAPDLSRRLWELSRTNPDLSRGDFMKKYLTDPFALALYETDAAPGPWLATDMEATDDFVRLNLERI